VYIVTYTYERGLTMQQFREYGFASAEEFGEAEREYYNQVRIDDAMHDELGDRAWFLLVYGEDES
jgi:hypothetical protein